MPQGKPYDFFISYKSEDTYLVRQIVDQMLGSGLKVWFFEYQEAVFYDDIDDIKDAILDGIHNSEKGICFSNDLYAQAEVCILEITELIKQCGIQNIIEIQMPKQPIFHQNHPQMVNAIQTEYQSVNQALEFIEKVVGKSIHRQKQLKFKRKRHTFHEYTKPFSLDLSGWISASSSLIPDRIHPETYKNSLLYLGLGFVIDASLIIGPMTKDTSRHFFLDDKNQPNERMFFTELKKAGISSIGYCSRPGISCFGAHLYTFKNITRWSQISMSAHGMLYPPFKVHSRLYSIVIPTHPRKPDVEFVMNFRLYGSQSMYYKQTYLMDRMIESFRWE